MLLSFRKVTKEEAHIMMRKAKNISIEFLRFAEKLVAPVEAAARHIHREKDMMTLWSESCVK